MKRTVCVLLAVLSLAACVKGSRSLSSETDSLSYVIGMNVGYNLLQMDSTLNVEAVCAAIRDTYDGRTTMSMADARDYFLRQMNYAKYEKFRKYEEQFLADLAKSNRSYARTRTGVTYRVGLVGNQQQLASSQRDSLVLSYRLSRGDGSYVAGSAEAPDTLRSQLSGLVQGLQEAVRMVGRGGHIDAWIPSDLAYGSGGSEELGIEPNTTLFYEIDVVEVIPYNKYRY